eukprot:6194851-Pleurochrysis_carterae.AAC.3
MYDASLSVEVSTRFRVGTIMRMAWHAAAHLIRLAVSMSAQMKIVKATEPDQFELCAADAMRRSTFSRICLQLDVAQAICDLEANSNDLKAELRELYIVAAKEVDVTGRKAVVIFVPFKLLKVVRKIQSRLVREVCEASQG